MPGRAAAGGFLDRVAEWAECAASRRKVDDRVSLFWKSDETQARPMPDGWGIGIWMETANGNPRRHGGGDGGERASVSVAGLGYVAVRFMLSLFLPKRY